MLKNKAFTYSVLVFLIVSFLSACSDGKVMSKKKMTDVLYDLYIAQAIAQNNYKDIGMTDVKAREVMKNSVLEKHGITEEVLDSSLVWYSDRAEVFNKINDAVSARLREQEDIYVALSKKEKDAEDLRNSDFPPFFRLTSKSSVFRFKIDSTAVQGLNLNSHSHFVYHVLGLSPSLKIKSEVNLTYSDTTVINHGYITDNSGSLNINYLEGRTPTGLSGYLRVDSVADAAALYTLLFYNFKIENDSVK